MEQNKNNSSYKEFFNISKHKCCKYSSSRVQTAGYKFYKRFCLTLSCIILKKGQTYFKNLVMSTSQDF